MPSVDDRVVSMKFDNRNFESQIESTIKSLNSLKESLKFSGVKTNLSDLGRIDRGITLDGLSRAVDKVSEKFNLLNAVAFATISNITNKAINAGQSLVKSLSLDQTLSGFREYEMNINSIQTILANTQSKGSTLSDVNKALDQLNAYSDQTIYNFGQMTKNIGTFTAAGIDLDTSVGAIKGIANVAAISGSSAEQASVAMYQLSQALATGTVRLIDWKSIENAGMGGEVFQKSLFETGKALGKLKGVNLNTTFDEWKASGNSFRGTLEEGWLTADVMTTTLQAFTGDLTQAQLVALGYTEQQAAEMEKLGKLGKSAATNVKTLSQLLSTLREAVGSGWSATFRTIFGDFEQARDLFSGWYSALSAIVSKQADARNKILGDWAELGGRKELIGGITIMFHNLILAIKPIRDAFRAIFPRKTGAELAALTVQFRQLAERLAMSEETAGKVRRIFKGVFAVFEIGFTIIKSIIKVVMSLFSAFSGVAGSPILDFLANFGDRLTALNNRLVSFGAIQKFFDGVVSAIQNAVKAFQVAIKFFKLGLDGVDVKFGETATWLDKFAFKAGQAFVKMGEFLSKVGKEIEKVAAAIGRFFSSSYKKILDFFKGGSESGDKTNKTLDETAKKFDLFATIGNTLASIWGGLIGIIKGVSKVFLSIATNIGSTVASVFNGFGETLSGKGFATLLGALAIGLFRFIGGFMKGGLIDLIGGRGMGKAVRELIDDVRGAFSALQKDLMADALLRIAKAIGVLAVALFVLSKIQEDRLGATLGATAAGLTMLIATLKLFEKIKMDQGSPVKFIALASSMVIISGALLVLSVALWALSRLGWEDIAKGLAVIGPLFAGLYFVLKEFTEKVDSKSVLGVAAAIWSLGSAIYKFAKAIKMLSEIPMDELKKGFYALTLIMGVLVAFIDSLPDNVEKKLKGIFVFSLALRLIVSSIKSMGNMDPMKLLMGLEGLVAILASLMITFVLLDRVDITKVTEGLLAFAATVLIISVAMRIIGTMKAGDWGKAIGGLVVVLIALLGAVLILDRMGDVSVGNLLALSAGLLLISLAFKHLADLSIGNILAGLFALGGALAVIIIAGAAAKAVAPGLYALGGAILMIGASVALIGVGVLALAQAFVVFGQLGNTGIEGFKKFLLGIADLLPAFIKQIVNGFIDMVNTIISVTPSLITKFMPVLVKFLKAIQSLLPEVGRTIIALIDTLLEIIRQKAPDFITLGFDILMNLAKGLLSRITEFTNTASKIVVKLFQALKANLPQMIKAGAEFLIAFLNGISQQIGPLALAVATLIAEFLNAIATYYTIIVEAGINLIVAFINGISESISAIVTAGADLIIRFIEGIGGNALRIVEAGFQTVIKFLEGLADSIRNNRRQLMDAGWDVLLAILEGVEEAVVDVKNWFLGLGGKVLGWIGDAGKWLLDAGKDILEGLWEGIKSMKDWLIGKIGWLVNLLPGFVKDILGISSPSKVFAEIGHYVSLGLAEGVTNTQSRKAVQSSMEAISNEVTNGFAPDQQRITKTAQETLEKSLKSLSAVDLMIETNPTIAPILDLTNVQQNASKLNTLLKTTPITADISTQQANSLVVATAAQADAAASTATTPTTTEIKFEQNVYSPTALSVSEIYRQTRNQITMAKEELAIT